MANGPLALLGDALASGTGDWANIQREQRAYDRARTDRKADIADARTFQREDTRDQREHEDRLYKERKLDAIRFELIRDGLLRPQDANTPEAFAAALAKLGPDAKELLHYQTEAMLGRAPSALIGMSVSQIAEARQLVKGNLDENKNTEEKGLDAAAKLINNHVAAIAKVDRDDATIDSEIARLSEGRFNANEAQQLKELALSSIEAGDLAKKPEKKWTPADHQNFRSIQAKQAQTFVAQKVYPLMKQKEGLNKERIALRSRDALVGTAISNPKIASRLVAGGAPAALVAEAAAPVAQHSAADVNLFGGGNGAPAVKTPQPVALGPEMAPALSIKGLAQRSGTAEEWAAAPMNVLAMPGQAIDAFGRVGAGVLNGLWNGNYSIPEKGWVTSAGEAIGGAIAGNPFAGEMAEREREDRILTAQPNSPEAAAIRRKRGMPAPIDQSVMPPALRYQ